MCVISALFLEGQVKYNLFMSLQKKFYKIALKSNKNINADESTSQTLVCFAVALILLCSIFTNETLIEGVSKSSKMLHFSLLFLLLVLPFYLSFSLSLLIGCCPFFCVCSSCSVLCTAQQFLFLSRKGFEHIICLTYHTLMIY